MLYPQLMRGAGYNNDPVYLLAELDGEGFVLFDASDPTNIIELWGYNPTYKMRIDYRPDYDPENNYFLVLDNTDSNQKVRVYDMGDFSSVPTFLGASGVLTELGHIFWVGSSQAVITNGANAQVVDYSNPASIVLGSLFTATGTSGIQQLMEKVPNTNDLIGFNSSTDDLNYFSQTVVGEPVIVGSLNNTTTAIAQSMVFDADRELAFCPWEGIGDLYAIDYSDPTNLVKTLLNASQRFKSVEYDPGTQTLFATKHGETPIRIYPFDVSDFGSVTPYSIFSTTVGDGPSLGGLYLDRTTKVLFVLGTDETGTIVPMIGAYDVSDPSNISLISTTTCTSFSGEVGGTLYGPGLRRILPN